MPRLWKLSDNVVGSVAFHYNSSKLLKNVSPETPEFDNLKSSPIKKYSSEIIVLTAVHVTNALEIQEGILSVATDFPYVDMLNLETL